MSLEKMAYPRYQGYQYETSPRKLEPQYEPRKNPYEKKKSSIQKKKKQNPKNGKKKQLKSRVKLVSYMVIAFSILFAMIYQNSLITESFKEKETLKKDLATIEKENEQLKVNIEKTLNLNNVEQSAKEMLGMQKLDNSQKVYINLPKKDYIESNVEEVIMEEGNTFWQKIIKNISKFIK